MHLEVLILAVCLATTLSGCDGPGARTVSGISQSSTSFNSGGGGVPGIDSGTVDRITLKAGPPEGVTFVIWSDFSSSGGHGGTRPGTNARESYYEGKMTGHDGKQVTFRISTSDGISGVLLFDGEDLRFNTNDGPLILVSTADGKLRAQQSNFNLRELPSDSSQICEFAKSNETISAFFRTRLSSRQSSLGGGTDESAEEYAPKENSPVHP